MGEKYKLRWSADAHRPSGSVHHSGGLMLWYGAWFLEKEPGSAWVHSPLVTGCCKASQRLLLLSRFFVKVKVLLGFFWVSKNVYWCRSFIRVKWCKVNFWKKRGKTYISINFNSRSYCLSLYFCVVCYNNWFSVIIPKQWSVATFMRVQGNTVPGYKVVAET